MAARAAPRPREAEFFRRVLNSKTPPARPDPKPRARPPTNIFPAPAAPPPPRSRRDVPCRPRRGRRTFCCGPPRAYRTGGPSAAGLRPRWSWPSWWRPLRQSGSCDGRGSLLCWLLLLFRPWLLFLRRSLLAGRLLRRNCLLHGVACTRSCAVTARQLFLAQHRLHTSDVFLQLADFLQALGLSHLQLKLHLEELVSHVPLLMGQFDIGQIANLVYIHRSE